MSPPPVPIRPPSISRRVAPGGAAPKQQERSDSQAAETVAAALEPSASAPQEAPSEEGPSKRPVRAASKPKSKSKPRPLPEGHPPRPPTAYFLFLKDRRSAIKQVNPQASVAEIAKIGGIEWGQLSEAQKEEWQEKSQEKLIQYRKDVSTWREAHPEAAKEWDESQAARGKRSTLQDGPPKRPPNAYQIFASQNRSKHRSKHRDSDATHSSPPRQEALADSWRALEVEGRLPYIRKAEELKQRHAQELFQWKQDHPEQAENLREDGSSAESIVSDGGTHYGRKGRRGLPPKKTVSDDEREYEALVAEHGQDLEALRKDPKQVSMADLAAASAEADGRASDRTFELERIRAKQLAEHKAARRAERADHLRAKAALREKLERSRRGEKVELPKRATLDSEGNAFGRKYPTELVKPDEQADHNGEAEEVVGNLDGNEEDDDAADVEEELNGGRRQRSGSLFQGVRDLDDDGSGGSDNDNDRRRPRQNAGTAEDSDHEEGSDAGSDTGSVRTFTSRGTHHSLRENAYAPQMRMVDGRIVVDESSLNVMRSQDQIFEEADMVEENTGHKFINSATASKRVKTPRWTKEETDEFFRGVSMWGTDFEMIARMFPNRNRKMIKAKWNKEDRSNGARLDLAFRRKLSVNVAEYSIMANVDLSGPAPEIKVGDEDESSLRARTQQKKEEGGDDDEEGHVTNEHGRGDDDAAIVHDLDPSSKALRKTSQTPDPLARRRGSVGGATSDGEGDGTNERHRRASSVVSTSYSTKGGPGQGTRKHQRDREREEREDREKRRRRSSIVSAGGVGDEHHTAGEEDPNAEEVVDLPLDYNMDD